MHKTKNKNDGFVAAYILIAITIVIVLLSGLLVFVSSSQRRSRAEVRKQQALQFAESGIYFYKWYLASQLDGKTDEQIEDFWNSGTVCGLDTDCHRTIENDSGQTVGEYDISVSFPDPTNPDTALVSSVGWPANHAGETRTVKARMRRPSWCEYTVLSNGDMSFWNDTEVWGKLHANGTIFFDGGVAYGEVTSSTADGIQPDDDDIYQGGTYDPYPPADFSSVQISINYLRNKAQESGGIYLPKDNSYEGYFVTLSNDGSEFEVCQVEDYSATKYTIKNKDLDNCQDVSLSNISLIFAEGNLWVEGGLLDEGQKLTMVSADIDSPGDSDLIIYGDTNAVCPSPEGNGDGTLGLLSEGNILFASVNNSNVQWCINAALMAQGGQVMITHITGASGTNAPKIKLTGAIISNGDFGITEEGEEYILGDKIYFDPSFLYDPPPFFPKKPFYEIDLWEEI